MPSPLVLLVNDDPLTNLLHAAVLGQHGFILREAHDGAHALQSCLDEVPDVVVMDIDMPVMNGLESLAEIRIAYSSGKLPYFAAIVTSARLDEERRNECLRLGAVAVHEKPLEIGVFLKSVQAAAAISQEVRACRQGLQPPSVA